MNTPPHPFQCPKCESKRHVAIDAQGERTCMRCGFVWQREPEGTTYVSTTDIAELRKRPDNDNDDEDGGKDVV